MPFRATPVQPPFSTNSVISVTTVARRGPMWALYAYWAPLPRVTAVIARKPDTPSYHSSHRLQSEAYETTSDKGAGTSTLSSTLIIGAPFWELPNVRVQRRQGWPQASPVVRCNDGS